MNSMRHYSLMLVAAALMTGGAAHAQQKPAGKSAYATVNGKAISKNLADTLTSAQAQQGQADSPELRNAVKEELVRREIIAQEAVKKGFDKKADVQAQMELARQGVLIGAYLKDYVAKHPVADAQVKQAYDDLKTRLGNKEYKVRHILVDGEDEAKGIIAKLQKGEKFEDLAKQSKDPGSKERGGDLGWANPASFVKPFSDAMIKLEKGKYTAQPVKSDFGWHVIQLDDTRDVKVPTFDEAKGQLAQQMQQGVVQKHVEELRAKAKVE